MCRKGGPRCADRRRRKQQEQPSPVPPIVTGYTRTVRTFTGVIEAPEADRTPAAPNPRTVDADGFVVGTDRAPRSFGSRPSVGGLSSVVQQGDKVGVIVGMDTGKDGGLALDLVWLDAKPGKPVSQRARQEAMRAYQEGRAESSQVPAAGLIALDAWLPDEH